MSSSSESIKTAYELKHSGSLLKQHSYQSIADDFKIFCNEANMKELRLDQQLKNFMPPYIDAIVYQASWTRGNYEETIVMAIFMKALKELNYNEVDIDLAFRINEQEFVTLYKSSFSKYLTLGLKQIDWHEFLDKVKIFAISYGVGTLAIIFYLQTSIIQWLWGGLCIFVLLCGLIFAHTWGTRKVKWQGWLIAISIIIIGQFFSLWEKLF